jgi:hypothetical protein
MNHARYRMALALFAQSLLVVLFACGGQSLTSLDDGGDAGPCSESVCPANKVWNPASCVCESVHDAKSQVPPDATAQCPPILCPAGWVQGMVGGQCACLSVDASIVVDAMPPTDTGSDVHRADASVDAPHDSTADTYVPPDDAPIFIDSPYDSPYSCGPTACGPGYEATPSCVCVACTNTCPAGESPTAGCGGCTPCGYKCPVGFVYGTGCSCGPPGTDAGPNAGDGGGVTCMLEGYLSCSAGSWCQLGICPDNTTQYGCYCNPDGTASCDLTCPVPPPCTIPGLGTCAYGAQCVFNGCAGNASSTELVCNCNSGGNASCYTSPCSEGGVGPGTDAGDGGVTCLLEGYYPCSAGSWCPLGTCPDNTTQYGCTCNADGTATCQLTCPAPAPCTIPGEGTCPYATSCIFGTCSGSSGTQLSCYCNSGGYATCNTIPCGPVDAGGPWPGG